MAKKKSSNVSYNIVTIDQKGTPETEWRRKVIVLDEDGNKRVMLPYVQPDKLNRLVSGYAFNKGEALAIFDERPYVDIDFLIEIHTDRKDEKAALEFQVIKENVLKTSEGKDVPSYKDPHKAS
jgi:hypothetical protein